MPKRSYTEAQFREALSSSTKWSEIAQELGLSSRGGNASLKKYAEELGVCTDHISRRTFTNEQLIAAVESSTSWAQVISKLDLRVGGSRYPQLKALAAELGLDTTHFLGKGWAKGKNGRKGTTKASLEEILVVASTYTNTAALKKRLWAEGLLEKRCSSCGTEEWFGKINHLQIDHINGERTDNRIDNLRILCANCHSCTDTWTGKNSKKKQQERALDSVE